ncbi:MAG: AAA family ATPase [Bacilli bacterium]|nr:AAA family ATPase [Bacilli bacterium]MCI9585048.1 AAA family ATPase [Bacilli bacterium]
MDDFDSILKKIDKRLSEIENRNGINFQVYEVHSNGLEDLNNLIGLENIKREIRKLVSYLEFINKVKDKANIDSLNLHMVFSGNPGTGKTTVARLLADILYSMGYIKNNAVVEITPQACIAGYVGQTAIKTKGILDTYRGGLIFIDEAYGFNNDEENGFAKDAIVEIIKEMEKKETVFVFAGYKNQMKEFIDINPGLKSRIGYTIDFNDYSADELFQMFKKKINDSNLKLDFDAEDEFKKLLDKTNIENSGNGRLVDNLYNKILLEHATRTKDIMDSNQLLTISKEDMNISEFMIKNEGVFFA